MNEKNDMNNLSQNLSKGIDLVKSDFDKYNRYFTYKFQEYNEKINYQNKLIENYEKKVNVRELIDNIFPILSQIRNLDIECNDLEEVKTKLPIYFSQLDCLFKNSGVYITPIRRNDNIKDLNYKYHISGDYKETQDKDLDGKVYLVEKMGCTIKEESNEILPEIKLYKYKEKEIEIKQNIEITDNNMNSSEINDNHIGINYKSDNNINLLNNNIDNEKVIDAFMENGYIRFKDNIWFDTESYRFLNLAKKTLIRISITEELNLGIINRPLKIMIKNNPFDIININNRNIIYNYEQENKDGVLVHYLVFKCLDSKEIIKRYRINIIERNKN